MQEAVEKTEERQILVFNLLNEEFGLEISRVREVLGPREIHRLPQVPDFIEGVIGLRGYVIAVVDLRKKFSIKSAEDTLKNRIIVCKVERLIVGLVVDSVSEIISLSRENVQPTPELVSTLVEGDLISAIAKLGERVITIVNPQAILTKEETTELLKI